MAPGTTCRLASARVRSVLLKYQLRFCRRLLLRASPPRQPARQQLSFSPPHGLALGCRGPLRPALILVLSEKRSWLRHRLPRGKSPTCRLRCRCLRSLLLRYWLVSLQHPRARRRTPTVLLTDQLVSSYERLPRVGSKYAMAIRPCFSRAFSRQARPIACRIGPVCRCGPAMLAVSISRSMVSRCLRSEEWARSETFGWNHKR